MFVKLSPLADVEDDSTVPDVLPVVTWLEK
jgi:hypothetical protein